MDAGKVHRAKEFLARGNDFAGHGLTAKAKEYWKIALNLDPDLTEAKDNLENASGEKSKPATKSDENERSAELFSKAQDAYDRKNYDLALKYLATMDSVAPGDSRSQRLREKITLENFQFDPHHDNENLIKNYFDQAVELYKAKDYEKALKVLGQAELMAPDQIQLNEFEAVIRDDYDSIWAGQEVQRAREQLKDGDKDTATETLDNVLKQQPSCKEALTLKAQMNKTDDQEKKESDQAELDKAKRDEDKDDFTDAKEHFEKALAINPDDPVAQEGLKRVKGLIDPVEQKLAELKKAYQAGDKAVAQDALNEIANLSPDFPKLAFWKKKIVGMERKKIKVELNLGQADAFYSLAKTDYTNNDFKKTKEDLQAALAFNPQFIQAQNFLNELLDEHPDVK